MDPAAAPPIPATAPKIPAIAVYRHRNTLAPNLYIRIIKPSSHPDHMHDDIDEIEPSAPSPYDYSHLTSRPTKDISAILDDLYSVKERAPKGAQMRKQYENALATIVPDKVERKSVSGWFHNVTNASGNNSTSMKKLKTAAAYLEIVVEKKAGRGDIERQILMDRRVYDFYLMRTDCLVLIPVFCAI
jgi:hypothetical protein